MKNLGNFNTNSLSADTIYLQGAPIGATGGLNNRIIVQTADDFGDTIDSSKEYFLDGIIDMGSKTITVPAGGIKVTGFNFDLSKMVSSENNYTMFSGTNSGNVLFKDFAIEVSGTSSQAYALTSNTGFDAYEIARINFNNCTSLGELCGFRQGFETGTGRFGGSPELTLSETWVGGYFIDSSIVRSLDSGSYGLFVSGNNFTMASRFRSNQNIDLPSGVTFFNFGSDNFVNENTVQLTDCLISVDGSFSFANDNEVIPNLLRSDVKAYFRNNTGIRNTYPGIALRVDSESQTNIAIGSTFYTVNAGSWDVSNAAHFDNPSAGRIRHLGVNPVEFNIFFSLGFAATQGNEIEVRIRKYPSGGSSFTYGNIRAEVNNFVGSRDVAFFRYTSSIILQQNDSFEIEVANNSGNINVTLEQDSTIRVSPR